jgi:hypothetical protein
MLVAKQLFATQLSQEAVYQISQFKLLPSLQETSITPLIQAKPLV